MNATDTPVGITTDLETPEGFTANAETSNGPALSPFYREKLDGLRESITRNRDYYTRQAEARQKELDSLEAKFLTLAAARDELIARGVPEDDVYFGWQDATLYVRTTEDELAEKVCPVVGRLDMDAAHKDLVYGKRKTITITVPAVRFPSVIVKYNHKLTETDPCRIERKKVTRTERTLTCEIRK